MHLFRTLFSICFIISVGLASPLVGPLRSSFDQTCCVYEKKLKRRDGEPSSHYYPEGEPHVPKGTSPNKVLPRDVLKREEDYGCACAAIVGSCTASCGNCTVSCTGIACATSCPGKKEKQKRDPSPDPELSSTAQELEKRDPSPDPDLSSSVQEIEKRDPSPNPDFLSNPQQIEKRDPEVGPLPSTADLTCCEYVKRKRSADPAEPDRFYPEGGHIPPGTTPNRIIPNELLKREEDYDCWCFAIFGTCSVNCGVGGQNSSGGGKMKRAEEKEKRNPEVGPLPSTADLTCCEYVKRKDKRSDEEETLYSREDFVPAGVSPNRILPREILKREEDYDCWCFAIFGTCSANCGVGGQNSTGGGKKKRNKLVSG